MCRKELSTCFSYVSVLTTAADMLCVHEEQRVFLIASSAHLVVYRSEKKVANKIFGEQYLAFCGH
jgi:hypothetical protein